MRFYPLPKRKFVVKFAQDGGMAFPRLAFELPNTACSRQRVRAGKLASPRRRVVRLIGWFASHPLSANAHRWAATQYQSIG